MKPNYTPSIVFSVLVHLFLVALVAYGGFFASLLFKEEKKRPTPKYINATLFDIKTTTTEASPNDLAKQKPDPVEKPPENKPEPKPDTPDKPDQQAAIKKQQEEQRQQEVQKQQEEQKQQEVQKQQEEQKQQKQKQEREAKIKQQKEADLAKLKAEKDKAAKAKATAEAKKKAEAKKAADAKKKAEAKKAADAKKKAADAKAKKEAQKKALQEKLKQSQKNSLSDKLRAEQSSKATQSYIGEIEQQFMRKWSRPSGVQEGIVAVLEIRFVPSGEVRGVKVVQSSGDANFDDSAVRAVKKAAPIAVIKKIPTDTFDKNFRSLKVRFNPW